VNQRKRKNEKEKRNSLGKKAREPDPSLSFSEDFAALIGAGIRNPSFLPGAFSSYLPFGGLSGLSILHSIC